MFAHSIEEVSLMETTMRIRKVSETITVYDFLCPYTGKLLHTVEVEWLEGFFA